MFSTPRTPQSNGPAKSTNKNLINDLKKRPEKAEGTWVDELRRVLWAYRTIKRSGTSEMPFSLAYGLEAVISTEVILSTLCSELADYSMNEIHISYN